MVKVVDVTKSNIREVKQTYGRQLAENLIRRFDLLGNACYRPEPDGASPELRKVFYDVCDELIGMTNTCVNMAITPTYFLRRTIDCRRRKFFGIMPFEGSVIPASQSVDELRSYLYGVEDYIHEGLDPGFLNDPLLRNLREVITRLHGDAKTKEIYPSSLWSLQNDDLSYLVQRQQDSYERALKAYEKMGKILDRLPPKVDETAVEEPQSLGGTSLLATILKLSCKIAFL
ncbi:hypothetical protein Ndes2526B_g00489 [Nannochloris sp. 'desiccata']|nr:hypothetical protein KSW81_003807 [Chlorella desiccata (nom. nud.)]KAH7624305.1 hypothetical protein NADE_003658 [Chlorella desiccata (nom. nud.)]